jgi:cell division protein FtsQ
MTDTAAHNRASDLRQRRSQQANQRVTTATYRATTATPSRPVVVRNTSFGTPIRRQAAVSQPRRQYYVALDTPGTELRLPALPVIRPGWRLLSTTIALGCLVALVSLLFSPFFKVGPVEVLGMERLTAPEVQAVISLENLSIIEVNSTDIKNQLIEKFPDLEQVAVAVALPASVTVTVKERTPVVAWKKGDSISWVDSSGIIFPKRGDVADLLTIHSEEAPPLYVAPQPVDDQALTQDANSSAVTGASTVDAAAQKVAAAAADLARLKKTGPDQIDPVLMEVSRTLATRLQAGTVLEYSKSNGLGWQDPNGYQVFIGQDLSNFEAKFNMAKTIAEQLSGRGINATLIDVENLNAPFYRTE